MPAGSVEEYVALSKISKFQSHSKPGLLKFYFVSSRSGYSLLVCC